LRRKGQEFFAVTPGKIRNRTNRTLEPQIAIGKRWDIAHVNAAAYHNTPTLDSAQCNRYERTDRRKDDRCIQFFWRNLV
jgi:hypothetical protein